MDTKTTYNTGRLLHFMSKMPKAKKKTKSAGSAVNVSDEMVATEVANVNKSPRVIRTRSRTRSNDAMDPINPSTSTIIGSDASNKKAKAKGKIVFDEMAKSDDGSRKWKAAEKKIKPGGKTNSPKPKKAKKVPKKVKGAALFTEDEQVMSMKVASGDENLFHTESSESEVSDGESDQQSMNDSDSDNYSSGNGEMSSSYDSSAESGSDSDSGQEKSTKSPAEKIKEIDRDMQTKMLELEAMMVEGSLTELAKVLRRCIDREKDKEKVGKQKPTTSDEVKKKKNKPPKSDRHGKEAYSGNTNDNHKSATKSVTVTPSEETIYQKAVEKRNSSSSEGFNTSDELINLPLMNVNISDEDASPPGEH